LALNTAFAAVFAREMGDQATFERLLAYANHQFDPTGGEKGQRYYQAKPAPYVTALLALALALPESGGGLRSLLEWRPDFKAPYLAEVSPGVDVTAAEWDGQTLRIRLQGLPGAPVELKFDNLAFRPIVRVEGVKAAQAEIISSFKDGNLILSLKLRGNSSEILLAAG
jgi:hypothetical protein